MKKTNKILKRNSVYLNIILIFMYIIIPSCNSQSDQNEYIFFDCFHDGLPKINDSSYYIHKNVDFLNIHLSSRIDDIYIIKRNENILVGLKNNDTEINFMPLILNKLDTIELVYSICNESTNCNKKKYTIKRFPNLNIDNKYYLFFELISYNNIDLEKFSFLIDIDKLEILNITLDDGISLRSWNKKEDCTLHLYSEDVQYL